MSHAYFRAAFPFLSFIYYLSWRMNTHMCYAIQTHGDRFARGASASPVLPPKVAAVLPLARSFVL